MSECSQIVPDMTWLMFLLKPGKIQLYLASSVCNYYYYFNSLYRLLYFIKDDNVVGAEALQFFVAGFETISSTLSFTLYELCIHPEIQDKVREEVLENIKRHDGITYEGMAEMTYLDMCVAGKL